MKISIIWKVIFFVAVINSLFALVFFNLFANYHHRFILEQEKTKALQTTISLADQVQKEFDLAEMLMRTIAHQANISIYLDKPDEDLKKQIITSLNDFNLGLRFANLSLLNKDGLLLISTQNNLEGRNDFERNYFQNALQGEFYIDLDINALNKELTFYFAYPIYQATSNDVAGIVLAQLKPEYIYELLNNFVEAGEKDYYLVDQNGLVIYSENDEKLYHSLAALSNEEMQQIKKARQLHNYQIEPLNYSSVLDQMNNYQQAINLESQADRNKESQEKNLSIVKIGKYPYFIILERTINQLTTDENNQLTLPIFYIFIIFSLNTIIIILIMSFLLRPLSKLHHFVNAFYRGNFNQQLAIHTRDEFQDIAVILNLLAGKLKQSYLKINQAIQDKTKDLREKVDTLEKMNELMTGRELKMMELKKALKNKAIHSGEKKIKKL